MQNTLTFKSSAYWIRSEQAPTQSTTQQPSFAHSSIKLHRGEILKLFFRLFTCQVYTLQATSAYLRLPGNSAKLKLLTHKRCFESWNSRSRFSLKSLFKLPIPFRPHILQWHRISPGYIWLNSKLHGKDKRYICGCTVKLYTAKQTSLVKHPILRFRDSVKYRINPSLETKDSGQCNLIATVC